MKTITSLLILLCVLITVSEAQELSKVLIKGRIIDNDTRKPIFNANVFLANTTIGTYTDEKGEFLIKNIPLGNYNIVFSFLGYETQVENIWANEFKTFNINIELKPKAIVLSEINVTAEFPDSWREKLKVFTREFLGETKNSEMTKILNPEVISFTEGSSREFKANADSIIIIENKALGYKLHVLLDTFIYNEESGVKSQSYPKFEELIPSSQEEKDMWEENRKNCYLGSCKHFFNSLIHHKLDENNFMVFRGGSGKRIISDLTYARGIAVPESLLVAECESDSSLYTFNHNVFHDENSFKVIWMVRSVKASIISFSSDFSLIDRYGNLLETTFSKETYGYWSKQRIADLLPDPVVY
ncbi:MAG: carboxypeptidase-like regulatory domain-containing protein [Syntrophothermus sp.]